MSGSTAQEGQNCHRFMSPHQTSSEAEDVLPAGTCIHTEHTFTYAYAHIHITSHTDHRQTPRALTWTQTTPTAWSFFPLLLSGVEVQQWLYIYMYIGTSASLQQLPLYHQLHLVIFPYFRFSHLYYCRNHSFSIAHEVSCKTLAFLTPSPAASFYVDPPWSVSAAFLHWSSAMSSLFSQGTSRNLCACLHSLVLSFLKVSERENFPIIVRSMRDRNSLKLFRKSFIHFFALIR